MKKQKLLHLHGLFWNISEFINKFEEDGIEFENYERLEVYPTSIHKSAASHEAATKALLKDITTSISDSDSSSEEIEVDDYILTASEAYKVLKEEGEVIISESDLFPRIELDEDIMDRLNPGAEELLERMEGKYIRSDTEEYEAGAEVYLKI
ncbi:MAG: UPF0058 family protein [Candidatus Nanohaloarchaea archaeon]